MSVVDDIRLLAKQGYRNDYLGYRNGAIEAIVGILKLLDVDVEALAEKIDNEFAS